MQLFFFRAFLVLLVAGIAIWLVLARLWDAVKPLPVYLRADFEREFSDLRKFWREGRFS